MSVSAKNAVEPDRQRAAGGAKEAGPSIAKSPPGPGVAPPPKLRRRPMLVAASLVVMCIGALLAVWAWTATSDTQQVVAVRSTIARGQVITLGDLVRVQVGVDAALSPVPADSIDAVVGKRAALDMAAGSLVTPAELTSAVLPPTGMSVVGVGVPVGLMPGTPLLAGDRIRVVLTPGQQGTASSGQPQTITARVVGVSSDQMGAPGAQALVSVQVPQSDAARLASWAGTGKVAIVLDSRER